MGSRPYSRRVPGDALDLYHAEPGRSNDEVRTSFCSRVTLRKFVFLTCVFRTCTHTQLQERNNNNDHQSQEKERSRHGRPRFLQFLQLRPQEIPQNPGGETVSVSVSFGHYHRHCISIRHYSNSSLRSSCFTSRPTRASSPTAFTSASPPCSTCVALES